MTRFICVTGTDTEVGKTVVTEALALGLTQRGLSVVAIKPVESGTEGNEANQASSEVAEDGVKLARATGQRAPTAALTRLRTPVAPPVAADLEGVELSADAWLEEIKVLSEGHDIALIEGAGGLLSPLTWSHTIVDLAQALSAEALVVVKNVLGCLNHTSLTLSALDQAGLPVAGVVMNEVERREGDHSVAHNLNSLKTTAPHLSVHGLGPITHPSEGADALGGLMDSLMASGPVDAHSNDRLPEADMGALPWSEHITSSLASIRDRGLFRVRAIMTPRGGLSAEVNGKAQVIFSSNDYLGLSFHPAVRRAASEAAQELGMGPRGSALICGHTEMHAALEADLAALCQTDTALLCPTGFAANLVVLEALADPDVAIFSDALNHASIIEGTRLAKRRGASVFVYPHRDLTALEALLETCQAKRKLIITDGVFSMDGDLAPLQGLASLKTRYGALLAVDEAHATGVLGARGAGAAEHLGTSDAVDLHIGTLSKALGSKGGFIAGDAALIALLENRGRAQIYSTALPLPTVAAARAALRVLRDEPEHRARLNHHITRLNAALGRHQDTPIFAHILKTPEATMAAASALAQRGLQVTGIRPPTVPKGTSRLRITLSAGHSEDEVSSLLDALLSLESGAL